MIAVPVAVPEIVLPTTLRPAGKPWTHTVAPGDATITATNGRPAVPPRFVEVIVGSGQGSMVMFVVAVAPHAAVAVIVAVPAAAGVPELTFPARVRPAGRWLAVIVGSGQAPTAMSTEADAPQGAVTIAWIVPVAVGVPVMTLPLRVRPAGRPLTASVAPGVSVNAVARGSPTVPVRTDAVMAGSGQALMGMSRLAVAPQAAVAVT